MKYVNIKYTCVWSSRRTLLYAQMQKVVQCPLGLFIIRSGVYHEHRFYITGFCRSRAYATRAKPARKTDRAEKKRRKKMATINLSAGLASSGEDTTRCSNRSRFTLCSLACAGKILPLAAYKPFINLLKGWKILETSRRHNARSRKPRKFRITDCAPGNRLFLYRNYFQCCQVARCFILYFLLLAIYCLSYTSTKRARRAPSVKALKSDASQ